MGAKRKSNPGSGEKKAKSLRTELAHITRITDWSL